MALSLPGSWNQVIFSSPTSLASCCTTRAISFHMHTNICTYNEHLNGGILGHACCPEHSHLLGPIEGQHEWQAESFSPQCWSATNAQAHPRGMGVVDLLGDCWGLEPLQAAVCSKEMQCSVQSIADEFDRASRPCQSFLIY